MNAVKDLHDQAMQHADNAFLARLRGDLEVAKAHATKALECELSAIRELAEYQEPTYSVLHRSAGTLALDCDDVRMAERMAAKALSREPPPEIAEELRDLLEQTHFRRHLELRGVTLTEDEIQMNVTGPAVGLGVVNSRELVNRVGNSTKLFRRIVERRLEQPFRERGPSGKDVKELCEVFVSVPRAASVSVTLRLGGPAQQKWLPGFRGLPAIVDEFMDLVELVDRAALSEIRERIGDSAYHRNFIGLVKQLLPDGQRIRQVGFTVTRDRAARAVGITRSSKDFRQLVQKDASRVSAESVSVRGTLLYADAMKSGGDEIHILKENGERQRVKVPEGLMSDIVRPMWDSVVEVVGRRQGPYVVLDEIEEVEEVGQEE